MRRSLLPICLLPLLFSPAAHSEDTPVRTLHIDSSALKKDLSDSLLGANAQQFRSHYSLRELLAQAPAFSTFLTNIGRPTLRLDGRNDYGWMSLEEHLALGGSNAGRLWAPLETIHAFCRSNGIRIIGSFRDERYIDPATGKVISFRDRPEAFDGAVVDNMKKLSWVVDHGYRDLYVGWEIGNECYATWDPALYGQFARKMIQAARKIQPDIRLAVPVILRDTDDPAIAKFIAANPSRKNWFTWHDTMLPALGDDLKNVTHLQIHIYGAASAYSCNQRGLDNISGILEKIPGTGHLRYFVTEWRYTGVGGVQHRTFRTGALWNAKFAMTLLSHPRVDASAAHEFLCTSGLGYWSPGDEWIFQYAAEGQGGKTPRLPNKGGKPALDIGPFGVVNRLLNEIAREFPLLLDHGADLGHMSSALFADGFKDSSPQGSNRDLHWFVCASRDRKKFGGFVVNTLSKPVEWSLTTAGRKLEVGGFQQMTCPIEKWTESEVPGEAKMWRVNASNGRRPSITLPPLSLTQFQGDF